MVAVLHQVMVVAGRRTAVAVDIRQAGPMVVAVATPVAVTLAVVVVGQRFLINQLSATNQFKINRISRKENHAVVVFLFWLLNDIVDYVILSKMLGIIKLWTS